MPQIREYTAQIDQLRPTETGVEALAMEGRRVGAFYNQAAETTKQSATDVARAAEVKTRAQGQEFRTFGDVGKDITTAASQFQDFEAHKEIGQLTPVLAKRMSDLSDQYQTAISPANADPAHADVAIAGFNEHVLEPAFNDMMDAASSPQAKKFVQDHVNQLREHYYEKQAADKSQLAAIAVKNGLAQSDNSWSNTAFGDPSSLDGLVGKNGKPGLIDTSITGLVDSNPNLRGVAGQQIKTDMTYAAKVNAVHSAFLGALGKTNDPDALLKQFTEKYPDYIKPNEAAQFAQAVKMQNKSNLLMQKQTDLVNKQQQENAVKKDANDSFTRNVTFDPTTGQPQISPNLIKDAIDIVRKYPDAPNAADQAKSIINWAESKQKGTKAYDDPGTIRDLTDRLYSPTNPTTRLQLMDANAKGTLSDTRFHAMDRLVTELETGPLKDPLFKNAMEGAKAQIVDRIPGYGISNPGVYENFVQAFIPQYLAAKRADPKLGPEVLDLKNPDSMISKAIAAYIPDTKKALPAAIGANGGLNPTGQPTAPAVPPPQQRPIGVYDTPRGKMRWTGTGWVTP